MRNHRNLMRKTLIKYINEESDIYNNEDSEHHLQVQDQWIIISGNGFYG